MPTKAPESIRVTAPDGTIVEAPAGSGLTLSDTGVRSLTSSASARGADITAQGDTALLETAETAPTLTLPTFLSKTGASLGGSTLAVLSKIEAQPIVLYLIGGGFFIVAFVVWYLTRDIKSAVVCAGVGVCVLGFAYYPWLLPVAIALGALTVFLLAHRAGAFRTTAQTIVKSVHADPVLEGQVKTAINQNAGTTVANKIKPIVNQLK